MSKKNIVSIEDRIPKLKQARKKKANRRLIFYLSIFFLLIAVIVYLQSPLSHVKTVQVNGNTFVHDTEIIEQSNLMNDTNIWTINEKEIKQAISKNPVIKSVSIDKKLPWTVKINIKEYKKVGYINKDNQYYPILGNGQLLDSLEQKTVNGDAPLLLNFTDKQVLQSMTDELKKLPSSILNIISEIHWVPSDENKKKIVLYMNDGYIVDGTIREFAEKMEVYPSIVAQLKPESKGIIHIGVGAYFESFDKKESAEEEIEDETEG
ncbi:cell division protein FtsQ/DivIB [Virgibacillus oceani]|uniref:Cell division protein DivIB n=1 Tax=Virgibacillus oceani TaxID=1479511 RepID=A0A917H7M3_9BACI|nr:cell division protein FtsQ/DivIB [Virgibacillus oceani]GGG69774.1 cell division protein DivIB [Virgibacillus oceani]